MFGTLIDKFASGNAASLLNDVNSLVKILIGLGVGSLRYCRNV